MPTLATVRPTGLPTRTLPTLALPPHAQPTGPEWVLAAPFRAHVLYLMQTAQVPWPVVAFQAGVPFATLRTLLYGREGRFRTKIPHHAAERLLDLRPQDLAWMRHAQVSAERTGGHIRLLRSRHVDWADIARFIEQDEDTTRAFAHRERTSCSVLTETLAQAACLAIGVHPWEHPEDVPDDAID